MCDTRIYLTGVPLIDLAAEGFELDLFLEAIEIPNTMSLLAILLEHPWTVLNPTCFNWPNLTNVFI